MIVSYILISLTWLITCAATFYFWVFKGLEPPWINWIVLAIIAFIPLVQKLKIGDFIELNKRVSGVRKEVDDIKQTMSSIQWQQLINVSIQGEKEARAFAEAITSRSNINPIFDDSGNIYSLTFSNNQPSNSYSEERRRVYFLEVADMYSNGFIPILNIMYYATLYKKTGKRPAAINVLEKLPLEVIKELQNNRDILFYNSDDAMTQAQEQFNAISRLMELRRDVHNKTRKPPEIEEGKQIIQNSAHALAWFTGAISTNFALMILSPLSLFLDNPTKANFLKSIGEDSTNS
ncbi:MAG: hypothetical protein ABSA18_10495 [Dehalococcoidia bacterium]|jgi:hypothetical protein